jgi:hypothetical protein
MWRHLSQSLPPLGDGVDRLIRAFPHCMAGNERIDDHCGGFPLAGSKDILPPSTHAAFPPL